MLKMFSKNNSKFTIYTGLKDINELYNYYKVDNNIKYTTNFYVDIKDLEKK